jgi:hypothetical protein
MQQIICKLPNTMPRQPSSCPSSQNTTKNCFITRWLIFERLGFDILVTLNWLIFGKLGLDIRPLELAVF